MEFPIIDIDTHYYEPRDCFSRYIEPDLRDSAIRVEKGPDGDDVVLWKDQQLTTVTSLFDEALKPGALREVMRAIKNDPGRSGNEAFRAAGGFVPMEPEWTSRTRRLEVMDEQGVQASAVFPSFGIMVEYHLRDDVPALYANLDAFNRWVEEEWGFAFENRIFAAPQLSLRDPELAARQVEDVVSRGARVAFLRPGHAYGRSPADPCFDRFWSVVNEAELVIGLHVAESGYLEEYSGNWSENPTPDTYGRSALQWTCFFGDRPIMDTLAAMVLHNLFGRFPKVRMLSVENGSIWVPYLLAAMDKMKGMGRSGPWLGGRVPGRPSDVFKEHVFVSPFHEEPLKPLLDLIGEDSIVFGSDYPHAEGIEHPDKYNGMLEGLSDQTVRKIMRENGCGLLGLAS